MNSFDQDSFVFGDSESKGVLRLTPEMRRAIRKLTDAEMAQFLLDRLDRDFKEILWSNGVHSMDAFKVSETAKNATVIRNWLTLVAGERKGKNS